MSKSSSKAALFAESLSISYSVNGDGVGYLILHGGAGPGSVVGLAAALSKSGRVLAPTHPGFNGEPRPEWFSRVSDLATAYLELIEKLGLDEVVVVGNSVGGWIAAEIALRRSPRIAGLVLLNAVGIDVEEGAPAILNPSTLPPSERGAAAFHDPARMGIAPTTPEALAVMEQNMKTLSVYAGQPFMHDPNLRDRLSGMSLPAMVIWGESDRIANVGYGQRFAKSIPGARFEAVPEAGHFPQIEQLDRVLSLIAAFRRNL